MFPIHVLYIRAGVYEVCSDDGRLSVAFPKRKEADIYADCLRSGGNELEAWGEVIKYRACKDEKNKRLKERYRLRTEAMKSLGMKRNTNGSWE